jgi:TolB-like protein
LRALRRVSIPELLLIVLLLVIAGALLWRSPRPSTEPARDEIAGPAAAEPAKSESTTAVAPPPHSIAVLPFVDMSEKQDQEYLADGVTEEILNLLTKIPELKVVGRTSSFRYKGKADDLRAIGPALGATYVAEGSVRRARDRSTSSTRAGTRRQSVTYGARLSLIRRSWVLPSRWR